MAGKTITQRIALEGGDQIRAQLDAIAKTGTEAFDKIKKAAADQSFLGRVSANFEAVKAKAAEIGEAAREVGDRFRNLGSSLADFGKRTALIVGAIAGAVTAFTAFLKSTSDVADNIAKTAAALGIATDQFQELEYAAGQAGVSQEQFSGALGRLSRFLENDAKKGLEAEKARRKLRREFGLGRITIEQYTQRVQEMRYEESQEISTLQRLGVERAVNADGTTNLTETQLRLADAFKNSSDDSLKAAASMEIFGRGNVKMVGFLNQGREAILAQQRQARELGLVISKEVLTRQEQLNDSFGRLGQAVRSTRVQFADVFQPGAIAIIDGIIEAMARTRQGTIDLGKAIATQLQPYIQDLLAVLAGRPEDVQNSIVIKIRDGVVLLGTAVQQAVTQIILPALAGLLTVLNVLAQAINGLFGTEWSGATLAAAVILIKLTGLWKVFTAAVGLAVAALRLFFVTLGGFPAIVALIGVGIALLVAQWLGGIEGIKTKWNEFVAFFTSLNNGLTEIVTTIVNAIVQAFKSGVDAIAGFFTGLFSGIVSIFQKIVEIATKAANAVKSAFSQATGGPAAAGGGEVRAAGGGYVRGPGSSRSDSIRAWLSNGEYVIKAAAVKKYGTRLFAALNGMRIPSPAFNMGGLVDTLGASLMPRTRFADGGLAVAPAGGGRPFTLNIDGQSFGGLTASENAVDQLERFAMNRAIRSAGRKPNWYRG